MQTIISKIAELKQQMYKLEDEAERLQIKAKSHRITSTFSKVMIFIDDDKIASEARLLRLKARELKHEIYELELKLKNQE